MKPTRSLIAEMATVLVQGGVDLGDERAVMRSLQAADYSIGDIPVLFDEVVEAARIRKAAFTTMQDVA